MNSTRWVTLTEFCKHLGRLGIARVDETDEGWFLTWIDSSPKAMAKAEASLKKDRATMGDEQRERLLIAEQIERAANEAPVASGSKSSSSDSPPAETGLVRADPEEKVVLSLSLKPKPISETTPRETAPIALKINPLKSASLKRPNVFKSGPAKVAPMNAAQRLIEEEESRKRRRVESA